MENLNTEYNKKNNMRLKDSDEIILETLGIFNNNPLIIDILSQTIDLITQFEKNHNIEGGIIKNQLAIHLPQLSLEDIYEVAPEIYPLKNNFFILKKNQITRVNTKNINILLDKIKDRIINISDNYKKFNIENIDYSNDHVKHHDNTLFVGNKEKGYDELTFSEINKDIGLEIQRKLHYIQKARSDTLFHYGLKLHGNIISYASLSELDRDYLLQLLPGGTKKEEVLVMTRAFNINKSAKNTMSALYTKIYQEIKNSKQYKYILTALNQNLPFNGASFTGASYFPLGFSPMEYYYDKNGLYTTRKGIEDDSTVYTNNIPTYPIIWLGRGTDTKYQKQIESHSKNLIYITKDSYKNG